MSSINKKDVASHQKGAGTPMMDPQMKNKSLIERDKISATLVTWNLAQKQEC